MRFLRYINVSGYVGTFDSFLKLHLPVLKQDEDESFPLSQYGLCTRPKVFSGPISGQSSFSFSTVSTMKVSFQSKKSSHLAIYWLLAAHSRNVLAQSQNASTESYDFIKYVDPLIGTVNGGV